MGSLQRGAAPTLGNARRTAQVVRNRLTAASSHTRPVPGLVGAVAIPSATLSGSASHDDEIELDERRAVETTPSGVVARVWLPVAFEDL